MAARPREVEPAEGRSAPGPLPVEQVYAAVESGLAEVLPGLSILDRDLELGGAAVAHLVAADAEGRLTLVLLAEGSGDGVVLAALDALRFARDNQEILERHLEFDELASARPPRVLLVADDFDAAVVGRLEPLLDTEVELYAVRTLKSAAGERAYLRPVRGRRAPDPAEGLEPTRFVDALPEDVRPLAELVLRRLSRVDEDVDTRTSRDHLLWRLGPHALARLAWSEGRLQAFAPPHAAPRVLRAEADVDRFVDDVLGRYMELVGEPQDVGHEPDPSEPPPGLMPEVVLTAEELEAFRE